MNNANPAVHDGEIVATIEIPRGSRNKYEIDHDTGAVFLDRYLFTSTQYPADYGFIANTLSDDGDPLDVFVLLEEPVFPGCHIRARVVGLIEMEDEAGIDEKLLCVPSSDPRWEVVQDIEDVTQHTKDEIAHFLEVYKALEPGKHSKIGDWLNAEKACVILQEAFENFKRQP